MYEIQLLQYFLFRISHGWSQLSAEPTSAPPHVMALARLRSQEPLEPMSAAPRRAVATLLDVFVQ